MPVHAGKFRYECWQNKNIKVGVYSINGNIDGATTVCAHE